MSDVSIFGERSGSAPVRDASAPASPIRRNPAKGLFGTPVAANSNVRLPHVPTNLRSVA